MQVRRVQPCCAAGSSPHANVFVRLLSKARLLPASCGRRWSAAAGGGPAPPTWRPAATKWRCASCGASACGCTGRPILAAHPLHLFSFLLGSTHCSPAPLLAGAPPMRAPRRAACSPRTTRWSSSACACWSCLERQLARKPCAASREGKTTRSGSKCCCSGLYRPRLQMERPAAAVPLAGARPLLRRGCCRSRLRARRSSRSCCCRCPPSAPAPARRTG